MRNAFKRVQMPAIGSLIHEIAVNICEKVIPNFAQLSYLDNRSTETLALCTRLLTIVVLIISQYIGWGCVMSINSGNICVIERDAADPHLIQWSLL